MGKRRKEALTAPRVEGFVCPDGLRQDFLMDSNLPFFGVRANPGGKKSYIFERKFAGKTIRITIGSSKTWGLADARKKAIEFAQNIDEGRDPREVKSEKTLADSEKRKEQRAKAITVGEVWLRYMEDRCSVWGELNYRDHEKMIAPGGVQKKNRQGISQPGPLASLMGLRLVDLNSAMIEEWAARESKTRPARVRLALRLLKAFLRWVAEQTDFKDKVDAGVASSRKAREVAGKAKAKSDHLQREQLSVWFAQVRQIQNPVISAYLQCLLLTGARREELARLRWEDVNFQWRGITLNDKVEESRSVPLTPYVAHLLQSLPHRNEWVFSSTTSKTGRLVEPAIAHRQACQAAGVTLTLHGLRRSFKSLTEWLEVPVGVVAQIMGHKPSATAEKHYTIRPLDLLRVHHEKIEAWIMEQAGIQFDPNAEAGKLRLVGKE
jgi:integrase